MCSGEEHGVGGESCFGEAVALHHVLFGETLNDGVNGLLSDIGIS